MRTSGRLRPFDNLTVVLAAAAATVPWLTGKLSSRVIAAVFAVLFALRATVAALALDLYPWSIALVLGVALAGGVSLGRLVLARFSAWLLLLVALSIMDLVQVVLTSGSSPPGRRGEHGPVLGQYLNLRLLLPRRLYSRSVITLALLRRRAGASWESCAENCTAEGQVDSSVVKRWARRFLVVEGQLVDAHQPVVPFRLALTAAMLASPAGSRSPDPQQEDQWERSPPTQP